MIYYSNQYETLIRNDHYYYEFDKEVSLEDIKKFIKDHYGRQQQQVCIHELGIDNYRFDFMSLNPYTHRIRILEYKANKNDFDGDRKHLDYILYCNTFAFVTPLGLITTDNLKDKRVGLLQIFRWRHRNRENVDWRFGAIWAKKPTGMKLEKEIYYRISDMMLARIVQGRKQDFF